MGPRMLGCRIGPQALVKLAGAEPGVSDYWTCVGVSAHVHSRN